MRDLDLGRRVRSESRSRVCWEGELLPSGIELTAPAAAIESSNWLRTAGLAVTRETRANTPVDRGATDPQGDAEVHGSRRADTLARCRCGRCAIHGRRRTANPHTAVRRCRRICQGRSPPPGSLRVSRGDLRPRQDGTTDRGHSAGLGHAWAGRAGDAGCRRPRPISGRRFRRAGTTRSAARSGSKARRPRAPRWGGWSSSRRGRATCPWPRRLASLGVASLGVRPMIEHGIIGEDEPAWRFEGVIVWKGAPRADHAAPEIAATLEEETDG